MRLGCVVLLCGLLACACSTRPKHSDSNTNTPGAGGSGGMNAASMNPGGAQGGGDRDAAEAPNPQKMTAHGDVMDDGGDEDGGATHSALDAGRDAMRAVVPVPPPQAQGCISDVTPGERTISCNGLDFILGVPESCITEQCGLIIDVHGGTMSAAMENKNTNMRALGRDHGYVVIQPNANIGLFDAMSDDPVVYAFANTVADVFHLDRKRIHMMGFSQGGYMTWRFICAHTDWLASAAPAAAAGAANISDEIGCTFTGSDVPKSGELDVMYMHGHKDALVDFANAEVLRDAVIAVYEAKDHEVIASDATFTRTRYTNARGIRFEFIEHDYVSDSEVGVPPIGVAIQGHCYPGSPDHEITEDGQLMAFGCVEPNSFTWGEEAVKFFEAHPHR
jgi:dienelactone hydrolase